MEDRPVSLGHYLFAYLSALALWLLLVGSLDAAEVVTGALVAMVVTLAARPRLQLLAGLRLEVTAPIHLFRYLIYFFIALIKANLDVARRVLSPSLPIQPALVEVETELQSDLGRLLLANSITLTPGTLSVDVRGERILVHWIDALPGRDLESATQAIVAGFERHLKGFLR
ncbi:Na+/H+ antiporter subunit E [Candidatus Endoriftia persephone]|uniref:Na+/H+ antiporter subunit E n=2 Tax=Gammaproteobacteria TaxID=1236 RepID=A0A9J7A1E8_9GAMM|nr:Na+/H+ antiporter subunit E [Candidatus Endoriftia persephone]EGV50839.1 putative cation antiporter [endosymbiont of Riftia pachyptila (vent Ph05)]USF88826.1 Na+/H+ antiporter subunit E [Candidatus Endoriftia persephone]